MVESPRPRKMIVLAVCSCVVALAGVAWFRSSTSTWHPVRETNVGLPPEAATHSHTVGWFVPERRELVTASWAPAEAEGQTDGWVAVWQLDDLREPRHEFGPAATLKPVLTGNRPIAVAVARGTRYLLYRLSDGALVEPVPRAPLSPYVSDVALDTVVPTTHPDDQGETVTLWDLEHGRNVLECVLPGDTTRIGQVQTPGVSARGLTAHSTWRWGLDAIVAPGGRHVALADGRGIRVYPRGADGTLGPPTWLVRYEPSADAAGDVYRRESDQALTFAPGGQHLLVAGWHAWEVEAKESGKRRSGKRSFRESWQLDGPAPHRAIELPPAETGLGHYSPAGTHLLVLEADALTLREAATGAILWQQQGFGGAAPGLVRGSHFPSDHVFVPGSQGDPGRPMLLDRPTDRGVVRPLPVPSGDAGQPTAAGGARGGPLVLLGHRSTQGDLAGFRGRWNDAFGLGSSAYWMGQYDVRSATLRRSREWSGGPLVTGFAVSEGTAYILRADGLLLEFDLLE